MVEDLQRILNNSEAQSFLEDFFLVKRIDQHLLAEGFRILYLNYHHQSIEHLIKSYKSLRKIADFGRENENKNWLTKHYMGLLSGDSNPKIFLNQVKDKLKEIEESVMA